MSWTSIRAVSHRTSRSAFGAVALSIVSLFALGCGDSNEPREGSERDGEDAPPSEQSPSGAVAAQVASGTGSSLWCKAKPTVDKYCAACHDGKGTGGSPMGLLSPADFQAANPSSPSTKVFTSVGARVHDTARPMPPKGVLPAADLAPLDAFIAAGAPAAADPTCGGSSAKPAPSDGRTDGWNPAECDEIYEIRSHAPSGANSPYVVPASSEIHPQVTVDAPWGNEQIQALAFQPLTDNSKVLHHWILYGAGRAFLAGWAPGDDQRPPLPKDVGIDMPTGRGSMTLDMHYYNLRGTTAEPDRSGVKVCALKRAHFRKNLAAVTMSLTSMGTGGVLAPANAVNRPATGTCRVSARQPVHILTAAPHAHRLAKHMKFVVQKRNGTQVVMHDQPFIYGEQGTYPVPGGEIIVENGDTITTTCVYTNTTNRNVSFGMNTDNEMCFNFALYWPKGALSCSLF